MPAVNEAQHDGEAPSAGADTPQVALEELVRAVTAPAGAGRGPDPNVAIAFTAGWHATEAAMAGAAADDGDADAADRLALMAAMLRADLAKLRAPLAAAEQDLTALTARLAALDAPDHRGPAAHAACAAFGTQLAAADFRLGKAFKLANLIVELARPPAAPPFDPADFAKRFAEQHDPLRDAVSQLATALPPNAGHSVRDSLDLWQAAMHDTPSGIRHLDVDAVRAQTERWRTLLSGEKAGRDTLELPDYVGIAEGVADEIGRVVRHGLKRLLPWVLLAAGVLVLGIVLILVFRHSAGVTAGIATVLAAAGLSWRGVGASVGRAVARVEQPAWAAQVDRAIAFAITSPLPDELLAGATEKSLLDGLRLWRRDHPRPQGQGPSRRGASFQREDDA